MTKQSAQIPAVSPPYLAQRALWKVDLRVVLLFILPLLILAFDTSWLYLDFQGASDSNHSTIDPWYYFGFFNDLGPLMKKFSRSYYAQRISWILPGALFYHYLPPLLAKYAFHLTYLYTALFSLYAILKKSTNPTAACLTTLVFGLFFPFLAQIGSSYVSGGGIAYMCLTLYFLSPPKRKWLFQTRLFCAGVFFSCMIYSQLFLIQFIPLYFLYFIFLYSPCSRKFAWKCLKSFAYGFFAITLCFSLINYALNKKIFFLLPSANFATKLLAKQNPWWTPVSEWSLTSIFTICCFGIVFIASLATLIPLFQNSDGEKAQEQSTFRRKVKQPAFLFFQLNFIFQFLLFAIWEFVLKHPVLSLPYYHCYLYPALFLAIGSLNIKGLFRWVYTALVGIILLVNTIHLSEVHLLDQQAEMKHAFLSVYKGLKEIKALSPKRNSFYWYSEEHPVLGNIFRSICSSHIWLACLVNEEFPQVKSSRGIRDLPLERKKIFVLSDEKDPLTTINNSLAPFGLEGKLLDEKVIDEGPYKYKITYIKVINH